MSAPNIGDRFDRLPPTPAQRCVDGRAARTEVLAYFEERFGIEPAVFDPYTFWEKGKGKVWAFRGTLPTPVEVETLGIHLLRTRQRYWKPTTDAMQLFGKYATTQIVELSREHARIFWRGESQPIEPICDPGYVLVAHELGGVSEPLGVGLLVDEELQSMVPKGRRRDLG